MKFETPPESAFGRGLQYLMVSDWVQIGVLLGVALFLLFALWRVIGNRRRGNACRWRKDKRRKSETLERWICTACGVDAFTSNGKPPRGCKRGLRDAGL